MGRNFSMQAMIVIAILLLVAAVVSMIAGMVMAKSVPGDYLAARGVKGDITDPPGVGYYLYVNGKHYELETWCPQSINNQDAQGRNHYKTFVINSSKISFVLCGSVIVPDKVFEVELIKYRKVTNRTFKREQLFQTSTVILTRPEVVDYNNVHYRKRFKDDVVILTPPELDPGLYKLRVSHWPGGPQTAEVVIHIINPKTMR